MTERKTHLHPFFSTPVWTYKLEKYQEILKPQKVSNFPSQSQYYELGAKTMISESMVFVEPVTTL